MERKNLSLAISAALKGGDAIMEIYSKDFAVDFKADQSPLTEADRKADQEIHHILGNTFPIISEETKAMPFEVRKDWSTCWLVDPLDGTKEFVKRNGEFTVNIALIENGTPVLGVVYLPVAHKLYFAGKEMGSFVYHPNSREELNDLNDIFIHATNLNQKTYPENYTIVASRSHMSAETEAFIEECKKKHGHIELISKGSSIKLCLVAEGKANVYPRIAPTMEWDTAAAHAVAKYSGCEVLDFNTRKELKYNKENLLNPHFIVIGK